jgi:hypothetical protein
MREYVSWNKRVAVCDHSVVDDVVDPLECPTRRAKGSMVVVDVIDDEGEATGPQKAKAGEGVGAGGVEGRSAGSVLPQPQSGKVAAAAVDAVVGRSGLWENAMGPVVGTAPSRLQARPQETP